MDLNTKLVGYFPFDDDGEDLAYNYAQSRTTEQDYLLPSDAKFTDDAVFGKAVQFTDAGAVLLSAQSADLSDLTLRCIDQREVFAVCQYTKSATGTISFILQHEGGNVEYTHNVSRNKWVHCVMQCTSDRNLQMFVDGVLVNEQEGIGEVDAVYITGSYNQPKNWAIDELRLYQRNLSTEEIAELMRPSEDVVYKIDGVDLSEFDVYVSASDGLLGGLEAKQPIEVDWPDEHGKVVDVSCVRFQPRTINLECFIHGRSKSDFVMKCQRFLYHIQSAGMHRLTCIYSNSPKHLVYDVYLGSSVDIDKTWNEAGMVGTFKITLIEPLPVKMVLRHNSRSAGYAMFSFSSENMISVSWGDGNNNCEVSDDGANWDARESSSNLCGEDVFVRHQYLNGGAYDIIVHGVIEDVEINNEHDGNQREIIVWKRL